MQVVASGVQVVGKTSFNTKNGDVLYKLKIGNKFGDLLEVVVDRKWYDTLVPWDEVYDMELDFYTVGYNLRSNLISAVKQ